jgi:hypothetical protein
LKLTTQTKFQFHTGSIKPAQMRQHDLATTGVSIPHWFDQAWSRTAAPRPPFQSFNSTLVRSSRARRGWPCGL